MTVRNKLLLTVSLCLLSLVGSYFIISKVFNNLENQLYEKCRIEALAGARSMSEVMRFMIRNRVLSEEAVFDTSYQKIPKTHPQKYHTRYDTLFDHWIQRIEDEFLRDRDIEYAVLMDKNGYVPTHNTSYSHARTGDYQKDLVHSRSKRIFSSYVGIKKVINYRGKGTIKVLYHRDTGETMWNIGAPVLVNNRHWGCFLIGVSLDRIKGIQNRMLAMIIVIMFVILGTTLLAILAIIPRKYHPTDIEMPR